MVPNSQIPLQRLLADDSKSRGLAVFGWAGVAVFAFLAAFASWQFAPAQKVAGLETNPVDTTGAIRQTRTPTGTNRVPTVPTPLPGEPSVSKDEFEALRLELKDLRRVIGRVDVSTDVLARRMSNLEEATSTGSISTPGKVNPKSLPPIAATPNPVPPPHVSEAPPPAAVTTTPPAPVTQATPGPAVVAPPPVAQQTAVPPTLTLPVPGTTLRTPAAETMEKSGLDRTAIDRATMERLLADRGNGLDPATRQLLPSLIAPPSTGTTIVPKTQPTMLAPPMTMPPVANVDVKPVEVKPADPKVALATVSPVVDKKPADVSMTGTIVSKPAEPTKPGDLPKASEPKPAVGPMPSTKPDGVAAVEDKPAAPVEPVAKFGLDLGGYKSVVQVKKAWSDLDSKQGKLTKGLVPLARLGEAADGIEIRLITGPFPTQETAQKACAQLRAASYKCVPAAYGGESLGPATPPTAPVITVRPNKT